VTHAAAHRAAPANHERTLVRTLREVAPELGLAVETLGDGWIVRVSRPASGGRPAIARHIYGYGFDLNPAGTHAIACDKAATSEVLAQQGVPRVEHRLFLHPRMAKFVAHDGTWRQLLNAWGSWSGDVVVKENAGTGGRDVLRCRTIVELEQAVYAHFERSNAIAVCPYHDIARETRFVMLDGRCLLAYEKTRLTVTGDGASTVLELLAHALMGAPGARSAAAGLLEEMDPAARAGLLDIPPAGQTRLLNWRHNLGQGAGVRVLDPGSSGCAAAHGAAVAAARAINLRFGSVDVVESADGAGPMILEINAGVMMEFLTRALPDGPALARRVYRAALEAMFAGV